MKKKKKRYKLSNVLKRCCENILNYFYTITLIKEIVLVNEKLGVTFLYIRKLERKRERDEEKETEKFVYVINFTRTIFIYFYLFI